MGFSHHLFYYVIVLIKRQMGPWMSLLFLASAVLFLRAKGSGRLVLFTAALLPLAAFTFISSKLVERTMPALPAFAVITAVGLCSLRRHWLRSAVFAPLAVLAAWPLVSGYADDLDRFTVEARAQRSYHTLVPAFQRLRAKIGSRADLGAGAFHTMFEYYHALAGFDGNVYTSSHDSEFYRLFGDLDIVTYVSADGSDPRWFDREYLEKRIEARKFYRPNELPVHLIDDVVASRPLFRLEGEAEIIGKHYLVYAKRDNQEDRTDSDRRDRSP